MSWNGSFLQTKVRESIKLHNVVTEVLFFFCHVGLVTHSRCLQTWTAFHHLLFLLCASNVGIWLCRGLIMQCWRGLGGIRHGMQYWVGGTPLKRKSILLVARYGQPQRTSGVKIACLWCHNMQVVEQLFTILFISFSRNSKWRVFALRLYPLF